jgi:fructose-bisphosphate aldolase class I
LVLHRHGGIPPRLPRDAVPRRRDEGFHISGVILFDETLRQNAADGTPLRDLIAGAGSLIGIKVDTGAVPLAELPG